MLYENEVQEFFSQPSNENKPTSKYFACENGTVRAKVAAKKVYSRYYNICFVNQDARDKFGIGYKGCSATYSDGTITMVWKKDGSEDIEVIGKKEQTETHNRVYEFKCDNEGIITGKHMGSKIAGDYNAQDSGITINEINTVSAQFMNAGKTEVNEAGEADLTAS